MVKSRSVGKISSVQLRSLADASGELCALSDCSPLKTLYTVLGPDAELHLVGGSVRDILCGKDNVDLDLATKFKPAELKAQLEARGLKVIETGIKHGTLTVLVDGEALELTTFRKPGPLGVDNFSETIEEDLKGRDFTINSIAFSLNKRCIIDPLGGVSDLQKEIIKGVDNPKARFSEDPLRILRLIRFGPGEDRTIDSETKTAAKALVASLDEVSIERVRDEFVRILLSPYPAKALREMLSFGLLKKIVPELLPAVGFEQNEHHIHDVFEHILATIERCPSDRLLRLTALFHDIDKPASLTVDEQGRRHFYSHETIGADTTKKVMKRLKFSNEEQRQVTSLVRYHMRPIDCGPAGVRRLMRDLGDLMEAWLAFKKADAPPLVSEAELKDKFDAFCELLRREEERLAEPSYGRLAVNGKDLIALGIKPGPGMGAVLKDLEELVIEDPEKNSKEFLLSEAVKLAGAELTGGSSHS